ncbi:MAG: hypothetical protein LBO78_01590 [Rickettsiales bacterium]|jgi:hypothetical protein|nr:hypothetical protein [Rickettsiales bacterium]
MFRYIITALAALAIPFEAYAAPRAANRARSAGSRGGGAAGTPAAAAPKTPEECTGIFYSCMDKKTNEATMTFDVFFDDYNDMLTDVYAGMKSPPFKCVFSKKAREIYTSNYYGIDSLSFESGTKNEDKIRRGSIGYYDYLKANAMDVSSGKIMPQHIYSGVLELVDITVFPRNQVPGNLPAVSYKVTTMDAGKALQEAQDFCFSAEKNPDMDGCPFKGMKLGSLVDDWKKADPITMDKSCMDYEVFLTDKKSKAKSAAVDFISTLKTKITENIQNYNDNTDAKDEMEDVW